MARALGAGDDGLAETGEVVLVSTSDLLDQPVQPQAFEQARNLGFRCVATCKPM